MLEKIQHPYDKTQLKSFRGLLNYMRGHLGMDFSTLLAPILQLTKQNAAFIWGPEQEKAFVDIKE